MEDDAIVVVALCQDKRVSRTQRIIIIRGKVDGFDKVSKAFAHKT